MNVEEIHQSELHRLRGAAMQITCKTSPLPDNWKEHPIYSTSRGILPRLDLDVHARLLEEAVRLFPNLKEEVALATEVLKEGALPSNPKLGTPELQFVWGVTVATLFFNYQELRHNWPEDLKVQSFEASPLWNAVLSDNTVIRELRHCAVYLATCSASPNTVLQWGTPGSWFWHNHQKKLINQDLSYSMVMGFDTHKATFLHENGHAQNDHESTPLFRRYYSDYLKARDAATDQPRGYTVPQYLELVRAGKMLELYKEASNALMDASANEHGIRAGELRILPQDVHTLNNLVRYYISSRLNDDYAQELLGPQRRLRCSIQLTDTGLAIVETPPHLISAKGKTDGDIFERRDAEYLFGYYLNKNLFRDDNSLYGWPAMGLEKPSPERRDEILRIVNDRTGLASLLPEIQLSRLELSMANTVAQSSRQLMARRYAEIDAIWNQELLAIANSLAAQAMAKAETSLKNPGPPSHGFDAGGSRILVDVPGQTPTEVGIPAPPQVDNADVPEAQKNLVEDAADKAKAVDPQDKDVDNKLPKRGTVQTLQEQQAREDRAREENIRKKTEEKERSRTAAAENARQAAAGAGDWIDQLPVGDLRKYDECRERWKPAITRTRSLMRRILQSQMESIAPERNGHSIVPENGNWSTFDPSRQEALQEKQARGERITVEDTKRCIVYKPRPRPTPCRIIIAVDGSGSMAIAERIQKATQAGLIIYEANKGLTDPDDAKRTLAETYIVVWGPDDPPILAMPGDSTEQIRERLQGIMDNKGLNTGTEAAPAIRKIAQVISQRTLTTQPNDLVGCTHIFFISDGDIADPVPAREAIETLLNNCCRMTVDIALLADSNPSITTVEQAKIRQRWQTVGIIHQSNVASVASELVTACLSKVQKFRSYLDPIPIELMTRQARRVVQLLSNKKEEEKKAPTKTRAP